MRPAASGVSHASDPLVLARTTDGFRVYAAGDPSHIYHVTGSPHMWTCTCPDFRTGNGTGSRECVHIRAVRLHDATPVVPQLRNRQDQSRATESNEHVNDPEYAPSPNGMAQMVLKRSVSPDGRIDALSVEF